MVNSSCTFSVSWVERGKIVTECSSSSGFELLVDPIIRSLLSFDTQSVGVEVVHKWRCMCLVRPVFASLRSSVFPASKDGDEGCGGPTGRQNIQWKNACLQ